MDKRKQDIKQIIEVNNDLYSLFLAIQNGRRS